jgi:hypothetical protein
LTTQAILGSIFPNLQQQPPPPQPPQPQQQQQQNAPPTLFPLPQSALFASHSNPSVVVNQPYLGSRPQPFQEEAYPLAPSYPGGPPFPSQFLQFPHPPSHFPNASQEDFDMSAPLPPTFFEKRYAVLFNLVVRFLIASPSVRSPHLFPTNSRRRKSEEPFWSWRRFEG